MKPAHTPEVNALFKLDGADDSHDLPLQKAMTMDGEAVLVSRWELNEAERTAIQNGALIRLVVWGEGTPPVALGVEGVDPDG